MPRFPIDFLADYNNDALLEELRRIASLSSVSTVTKAQIDTSGRVSYSLIIRRFGSLRQALQLAGLTPQRFTKPSESELVAILVELWTLALEKEGRRPQRKDLAVYGFPISSDTFVRRFGTWKKALLIAAASVESEGPEANLIETPTSASAGVRKDLSVRKRFFVMKRDHFACARCQRSGFGVRLEVHHVVPFAKGGSDALDNLQTLCFECNRGQREDFA